MHAQTVLMLFGVLDLARDAGGAIETALAMHAADAVCLYRAPLAESIRRRAPHLVKLPPGSEFSRIWFEHGWGSAWGILVSSELPLDGLRDHLRRFLTVYVPGGRSALFRFYDPRVFPAYLRSCNASELRRWFDGVDAFRVEMPPPRIHADFSFDGQALVER